MSVFRRTHRHASCAGLVGELHRRAGVGHRQIGRFARWPGGARGRNCLAAVQQRLQPGEAPYGRFTACCVGGVHAGLQCVVAGTAGLVAVADHAGTVGGVRLRLRHRAGCGVHRAGVLDVLPADPAHRPGPGAHGDLSGAGVRRAAGRTVDLDDAGGRGTDPRQHGLQPARPPSHARRAFTNPESRIPIQPAAGGVCTGNGTLHRSICPAGRL